MDHEVDDLVHLSLVRCHLLSLLRLLLALLQHPFLPLLLLWPLAVRLLLPPPYERLGGRPE